MNKQEYDQNVKITKTHLFLFFKKIVTFTSTNKNNMKRDPVNGICLLRVFSFHPTLS